MKRILNIKPSASFIALISAIAGIISVYWSYTNHTILIYGDAESHLNIAKRVTSSITPGLSQLGGIWLPIPHMLMAPLAMNDFLWRSGLAGSIVSLAGFVLAGYMLFKLSYLVSKNYWAAFIASLIFILNPNSLYLATTPLDEILMFAFAVSSTYFFIKWIYTEELPSIVFASFFAFLASLTRYDGWFLVISELAVIWMITIMKSKSWKKAEGITVMYALLALLGIFLWLMWNKLIFGNFLYFADSQYGSKSQQMWFFDRGYLPTYGNIKLSFLYYLTDTWVISGIIAAVLGLTGFIFYSLSIIKKRFNVESLALYILLFPLAFYTVALYMGHASLILPEFAKPWYQWTLSNVRYGIQMLLPICVFTAFLISRLRLKLLKFIVLALIIFQNTYFIYSGNVLSYADGVSGLSSKKLAEGPDAPAVEAWISKNYTGGLVLMDDYRRPISPVNSNIPMQNFINIGNKPYWQESMDNPTRFAEWIILQKADTDGVWASMTNKQILYDYFVNVYSSGNIWVYKKRDITDDNEFVKKRGQELVLAGKPFTFYGGNMYDLVSQDTNTIDKMLQQAKDNGINVIRIWGFNKTGNMNTSDFTKLDYALTDARRKGIRFVITLGNNWDDYGGRKIYVTGTNEDTFYSSKTSEVLYEKEMESVINHKNDINGIEYKDDPTVLSWDILNEPRLETDKSGIILAKWIEIMGQYVLSLDSKHLLTVGTEGFIIKNQKTPYYENHGSDFSTICSLSVIDLCTAHLYPKYFPTTPQQTDIEQALNNWQNISVQLHKPFYLGEVGFDLTQSQPGSQTDQRFSYFYSVKQIAERKNLAGAMLWNLANVHDNYFSLSFGNSEDSNVISLWNKNI